LYVGRFAFMHKYLDDLLFLIGATLIVIGVAQIYTPAAWIVAGAFMIAGAVLYAKASAPVEVKYDPEQGD
jgi:hypothetical protein